ncbi:hypothetical protein LV84_03159 [Algoriphagus ratkowskyi]|uniref:Uncharacterized protein n=1 Tax=Algoriphagus ratkowskyi TaxID=57028 RepID=A0A2W7RRJ3_9BACT|nr:hypothetical protein LV84_03159 [Algoriphagus ratkowskyi]
MYIHFSASIALKEVVKARIEATSVTGLRSSGQQTKENKTSCIITDNHIDFTHFLKTT